MKASFTENRQRTSAAPNIGRRDDRGGSSGLNDARKSDPDSIRPGCKVSHPKWGVGTVVSREGSGLDAQVKVAFAGLGIKSLILGLANLEKIE